jgi:hypothetical protein
LESQLVLPYLTISPRPTTPTGVAAAFQGVDYIRIVDYHIYKIYLVSRIDIIYCRLLFVSRGVLSLDFCTLYISVEKHNVIHSTIICNIFFLYDIRLGSDPRSLPVPSIASPQGDQSRLHRRQHPYFVADSIDMVAFIALTSSCNNRLEVSSCRQGGLTVLCKQHVEHLEVAVVCPALVLRVLTTLQQCVQVHVYRRRWP